VLGVMASYALPAFIFPGMRSLWIEISSGGKAS
jgi:hypothetical protein